MIGGDNWTPDTTQWKRICQKIAELPDIETIATSPGVPFAAYPTPTVMHVPTAAPVAQNLFDSAPAPSSPPLVHSAPNPIMPSSPDQKATLKRLPDGSVDPNAFL